MPGGRHGLSESENPTLASFPSDTKSSSFPLPRFKHASQCIILTWPWHLFRQVQFFLFPPFRNLNPESKSYWHLSHLAKARNLFRQMQLFFRDWLKRLKREEKRGNVLRRRRLTVRQPRKWLLAGLLTFKWAIIIIIIAATTIITTIIITIINCHQHHHQHNHHITTTIIKS